MGEGGARRRRMSPALRAFLAVDVVLVLAFVAVLLLTRTGGGEPEAETPDRSPSEVEASQATAAEDSPSASDEPSPSPSDEVRLFASPSGNIVCSITPENASCSIAELSEEGLVEDETCDGTVGHVVLVTDDGAERPCVEGRPPGKAPEATPELDYDDSTSSFGFTCTSSRSGVICRHDESGHGFSIARAGSSLF